MNNKFSHSTNICGERHDPFFKVETWPIFQGFLEKIHSNSRFSTFSRSSRNPVKRCKDLYGGTDQCNCARGGEGGGVLLAAWVGRGWGARAQAGYVTGRWNMIHKVLTPLDKFWEETGYAVTSHQQPDRSHPFHVSRENMIIHYKKHTFIYTCTKSSIILYKITKPDSYRTTVFLQLTFMSAPVNMVYSIPTMFYMPDFQCSVKWKWNSYKR